MPEERRSTEDGCVVELVDVSLERGDAHILSGISWAVERGRHWALLGANGSGKTTLLKVVTGYEWPTRGDVAVLGERYGECDLPRLRLCIGWISAAIEPWFPANDTALDVVVSGYAASMGLYRKFSEAEWTSAWRALQRMGAASIAERPYRLLSQGEQQRVLIARGLVGEPVLMILDEPCAGLDPAAREAFLEDLGTLATADNAPTLLLVTHHIEEIGPWIDNVLVLRDGRQVAVGPTADVLTGAVLTEAFGRRCKVDRAGSWFRLAFARP